MNILGGLFGRYGDPVSVSDLEHGVRRAVTSTASGVSVNEYLALNLTSVYAAVGVVADTISQLPVHVYRRTATGREVVTDHPVAELLSRQVNQYLVPFTYKQTSHSHRMLWGNGYSEIVRNGRGQAVSLEILEPDRTRPEEDQQTGELRYRYQGARGQAKFRPEDVLHIKGLGHNGLMGYSPIALHRNAIGLTMAMETFGSKFFANDAKSGGFLQHPHKLTEAAQKNLSESMSGQGGLENAFKVKILEEGMKFIQTTIPPDDAQFLGSREFQIAEVARIYRVPLVLLQSMEKTSSWGSGVEQLLLGFVKFTIAPEVIAWEQEMNRRLFTPAEQAQGYFVKFAMNALLRGDMSSRAEFYKTLAEISGLTPNEIRELEEMNPIPGLDEPYMPTNWQLARQAGANNPENDQ